ncbi:MAG TPA: FUSC family protein [Solirubrobacter sp.]|nr:FUSC family protein [Solirubrobacter sp.]
MIPEGLFEDAAERSRVSMRTRLGRVRASWRTMVQAAIAVGASWAVAKWAWGHEAPFFAPVSAIIAIGQSYYQRGRRAVELVAAATLGVAIAELLAHVIGRGVPQLAVGVFLAMGLGLFFGTTPLFVNQVAVSAALVFTIVPAAGGVAFGRTLDAATGGALALVVAAVVLPADPLRALREAARPVLEELAATLEDVAGALRRRDGEAAEAALVRGRGIDELGERFSAAARESFSTTRISPARRRVRGTVAFYAEAAARIDLAVRNVRVLARGAMRAIALGDNVPPEVAEALDDLAAAVRALRGALATGKDFDAVREPALRAAASATTVLEGTTNLSVSVIVGQVRSTATDLLTGIGLSYQEAADAVRSAAA